MTEPTITRHPTSPHTFAFTDDDFNVTITANVDDWTWTRLVNATVRALTEPSAVITFPGAASTEDVERIRGEWTRPFGRKRGSG